MLPPLPKEDVEILRRLISTPVYTIIEKGYMGTPKNLAEAIRNGLNYPCASIESSAMEFESAVWSHIKDFLSQKFQAAKFLAHQGKFSTEADVQLLFDACTMHKPPLMIKDL